MIKTWILIFILSFSIAAIAIPIIIYLSKRYNLFDRTDHRKLHDEKISRLGGLGIFLGFTIPFLIVVGGLEQAPFHVPLYLVAVFVIFFTGFIDDITHLRARYKLLLQLVAGLLVACSGLMFTNIRIFDIVRIEFGIWSYPITILWILVFVNAINLLDGLDGLASGMVFIANIFVLLLALSTENILVAQISIIMAGTILGFYIYNFPPAKIFMGDGGAYLLGFIYATLPLMGVKKASVAVLFLIPIILLLLPLLDIVQVIVKRMKLGYNIFMADKNHLHHRLLHIGLSKRGVLFVMYVYTVILGLASLLLLHIEPKYSLFLFMIIFLLVTVSLFLLHSAERIIHDKERDET